MVPIAWRRHFIAGDTGDIIDEKETAMNFRIHPARKGQARSCLRCVQQSDLWDAYFKSHARAERDIREMIDRQQIYVASNRENDCLGFMGVIHDGCFRKFSYLSLIAVRPEYRGRGIGRALIEKFEEMGFERADRVFLLVSDFNLRAQKLYADLGYTRVGTIPDLFKKGAAEQLMVKNNR